MARPPRSAKAAKAPKSSKPAKPSKAAKSEKRTKQAGAPVPALEPATLWFHPRRGALISRAPLHPDVLRHRSGSGSEWREVMKLRMELGEYQESRPVVGQKLPSGFLWGDVNKQRFGMGGPQEVFGPIDKTCRSCGAPFVFTAAAQKHLLEETGAFVDATAVRCLACRQHKQKLERARRAHALALELLAAQGERASTAAGAAAYLAAARAALAVLEADGATSLERAISHSRKARKLGAKGADEVEQRLADIRAARAAERDGGRTR